MQETGSLARLDRTARGTTVGALLLCLIAVGLLTGCAGATLTGPVGEGLRAARLLTQHALLYLLPGGVLVVWLWREGHWVERVILAAGLGVAIQALLIYATLTGLRLGPGTIVVVLVFCAAGIVVRGVLDRAWIERWIRAWRALKDGRGNALGRWRGQLFSSDGLAVLTLGAVLMLVLGVRLYVVRSLAVPLWGDGYQHTMMAQLIVDNRGLFDSWAPYAPLTTFTYHFGFHANVASFHWLSGDPVIHATIWVGQILNALAALCLYPLAVKVSGGKRWAGVGAVLVAGLLLPMPMYYLNWGRYTQLAGQVLLVVAVYLTWTFIQAPKRGPRIVPVWIAVAGLAVTHYRALVFYVVFVLACLLLSWRRNLGRAAWVGGGALLLFVPWLVRLLPGQISQVLLHQVTTAATKVSTFDVQYNTIGNIKLFMAPWAWLLLAISLGLGLWRRQRGVLTVALWWFVLLVLTNPRWVSLPGTGAISNFALFIALYIPAGILVGNAVGALMSALTRVSWGQAVWPILGALCVILVGMAGARRRVADLHVAGHNLVTRNDLEAMVWVRENTPADARFLVNSFPAYGGTLVVGSDAGWWMPLLADRANSVPPLNYGTERGPVSDYVAQVNELTYALQRLELNAPETVQMLCERGFTHVYIGQRQGRVNYGGPHVLSLEEMLRSSSYRLIYQQDKVAILEISCDPDVSRSIWGAHSEGL
jgi:hypothetical protein